MKSRQAEKLIGEINQAIKDIDGFQKVSDLEKSYLAKFLVVFICGVYEEVIESIINERIDRYGHSEVSKYIKDTLFAQFRNPDISAIKGLLGKFDDNWKTEITNLPQSAQTAITNIVNDKNSLAHGNSVNLTLLDVRQYYNDSMVVINKIDDMLI